MINLQVVSVDELTDMLCSKEGIQTVVSGGIQIHFYEESGKKYLVIENPMSHCESLVYAH